ncbi:iron ABC transporter permease [Lentilactobacillus hilgardii]|nr:iron ABC transporter permease [Lentilactobacillus hilgardii]MCV3741716.1 iron ABC transporter permease [Lentilactobacillus hilgardii]
MTRRIRLVLIFMILCTIWIGLLLAVLSFGDIKLNVVEVMKSLFGLNRDFTTNFVVWQLRFPGLLASIITGGELAVSGLILQILTHNSLADSSILGINAGASLGVVIAMFVSAAVGLHLMSSWLLLAALIGGLTSSGLLMLVGRQQSAIKILLAGVALTAVLNGIILMLELEMNQFDFDKVLVWLNGSFWNLGMPFLTTQLLFGIGLIILVILMVPALNGLTLGSRGAYGIGVNVKVAGNVLMGVAILCATGAVLVGGAISFVGLMAPNIARKLVGQRVTYLLPTSWLLGCCIMMLAQFVATNAFGKTALPVGLVVSAVTMPYFIYLLFSERID